MKKSSHSRGQSSRGFELFESGDSPSQEQISIFTDSNARIPELDGSDDNPFLGPRQTRNSISQWRVKTDEEEALDERVKRGEGVMYVL